MSTTTDLPVVRPSDLGPPIYVGSVQRLYAVPGRDDLMVCETTNAGSVFDVGSIFDIPGSDVARATFRHALYTRMAQPKTWIKVREAIQKEIAKPEASAEARAFLEDLLVGPLEKMVVSGANTHHTGMLDSVTGEITAGMPENPSTFNVVRRFPVMKPVQKPILLLRLRLFHVLPGGHVRDPAGVHRAFRHHRRVLRAAQVRQPERC
ncbi:hypothetical protein [Verrucomicrobium spinosum]|uniref:hypothetical protein n=1 Tax=Verrucomicrobium spinosum TaxID=2736 RepID=UPI0012E24922|nr:hypothetical protein [Verrucomicrobium spinosum]